MKYIIKNINAINDDFYEYLSDNDKIKYNKIIYENKKKQFLLGRYLLNELLNENYNISYKDIELSFNENGKPYIIGKEIYFNISHSDEYVICVIDDNEIGVDIEKIKETNIKYIKQYATNEEIRWINNDFTKAFVIYTLKEAYFKYKGTNLNMIKDISFNPSNNTSSDANITYELLNNIVNYCISIVYEK